MNIYAVMLDELNMIMEQQRSNTKKCSPTYTEVNLSQSHFVHNKSHM
jgi:hypothetical protein